MSEVQATEEVNRIMQAVDKNKSGGIDYTGKNMVLMERICYGFDKQIKAS
jgi:hypothetical protein